MYVALGGGTGTWRKLFPNDLDHSDLTKNINGWNDISDSLYTVASPRAIAATTRTQLTNNAAAPQSTNVRLGSLWNTSTNKFLINDVNAVYSLRLSAKIKAAAAAGTPYMVKLELQSDNGNTVILAHDTSIKGGGYENCVALTDTIYNGSFINNQGLALFITADTAITLYDVGFVIQRTYKES